ncbi:multidrug DMT transporter permease [Edaphobacter acidisoli]|uniref:Multidrug DMT transporter permease n=1 Tax=Edaphobacter acidisoli TaxID=2040573 RepID=A0A916RU01_9BACT|nr:GRP family sugar transporter [Edaphobacter acidisoli]GGA67444.1 multidrug DMT transporter permease [Edaphobacter acidisoli]
MYQPEAYWIALLLMLVSMLCWGSWANAVKLCPGYRFQLFYWDYVLGLIAAAVVWGLTFGSFGSTGMPFLQDVAKTSSQALLLAFAGGAVFNIANLLLVAAIDIAGLAVAFPVGIGLALVVGAVSNYILSPKGNPLLLFGGIALVVGAIVLDAMAYRQRESGQPRSARRGLIISLISGLLMGSFYPLVSGAMSGEHAIEPYAAVLFFAIGVAVCAVPVNYLFMRFPLDAGLPVKMQSYRVAPLRWHLAGILGGAIWCTGALANFLASKAHIVGPAVSYSIGQGATMISAAWGVFIWHEFASASPRARILLTWMFILFLSGLGTIAIAPLSNLR